MKKHTFLGMRYNDILDSIHAWGKSNLFSKILSVTIYPYGDDYGATILYN